MLKLVAGGLVGALTGSWLAGRVAQKPLRVALLIMLSILGCQGAFHGSPAPNARRLARRSQETLRLQADNPAAASAIIALSWPINPIDLAAPA